MTATPTAVVPPAAAAHFSNPLFEADLAFPIADAARMVL